MLDNVSKIKELLKVCDEVVATVRNPYVTDLVIRFSNALRKELESDKPIDVDPSREEGGL